MKSIKDSMLLYAVTDRSWLNRRTVKEQVEDALKGGATFIQLREKELDYDSFLAEALELKALCKKYDVPFVINDNVDIAIACDADGVHVGQSDMEAGNVREKLGPGKIIGVSAHNLEEALAAKAHGADYLGVGAVFSTSTKLDADTTSFGVVYDICNSVNIPVVAIGGINENNILELKDTGIDGVAVVSAIFAKPDITAATENLLALAKELVAPSHNIKKVLTIAGTDPTGGAGIQADIKTITAHKLYAMSAITALVAQNTTGVYGIMEVPPEFVANQLDCIFTDIRPDAVKIGMVSSSIIIEVIVQKLKEYKAENIVVDPVMVTTSGSKLISDEACETLITKLLPLGTVITPNIPEAEVLCGFNIKTTDDMIKAAEKISENVKSAILIKGGHLVSTATDLLYENGEITWFSSERIDNPNTHGTGCTLSSAIASNLAKGYTLKESIANAKDYLTGALKAQLNIGKGSGPLDHTFNIKY
ncbi:MAG: bifunctional hydroxymethylpyrimidine kinase/phosphomethylpyrimidine kinase [Candidatus Metalachnospira sp.]|nr:bifunctional hydroxymethylpyrimidine kinase/phosphomethylpyrimidine kinase [Candidatus Metalachnospira sp.]